MTVREPAGVLAALDEILFPAGMRYDARTLAAAAGIEVELAERLWRAMGFSAVPLDLLAYSDDDLRALQVAVDAMQSGTTEDQIVHDTRIIAAALARVAEVSSDVIIERIGELEPDDQRQFEALLVYFYRRHLRAALWRKLADPQRVGDRASLTVGFVDLVRFTALTEGIAEERLGELIDRFESVTHSEVTEGGGRIVKMIGDEVMFVCEDRAAAVRIALSLVQAFDEDESVPPARAGLAAGDVLARSGDYFGPVVNLAARIVDVARPSSVVTSDELHGALADEPELAWSRIPPRRLRGVGRAPLWRVEWTGS